MQDIDKIYEILKAWDCVPVTYSVNDEVFQRRIKFHVGGLIYEIEWFSNESYLSIGGKYDNQIPFTKIEHNETWPSFKHGFKVYNGEKIVCLIALKKHDWQD